MNFHAIVQLRLRRGSRTRRRNFSVREPGTVDVSGGHHDAAITANTRSHAQLVHLLVFAADSLPGVGALDNLGIPESGRWKKVIFLQEAKWEADFLAKLQDADGGFYFLVYRATANTKNDVLPTTRTADCLAEKHRRHRRPPWPRSPKVRPRRCSSGNFRRRRPIISKAATRLEILDGRDWGITARPARIKNC